MSVCVWSVGKQGAGQRPNDFPLSNTVTYKKSSACSTSSRPEDPCLQGPGIWYSIFMSLSVKFCELTATRLPAGTASGLLCSIFDIKIN